MAPPRAPSLRLHAFEPRSTANGPGVRAVLWVQGCTLGCPGCFNPETHHYGGDEVPAHEIFSRILALGDPVEGVTVSGGEPLQQRRAVLHLLERVRVETPLSTVLFTGYRWSEVARMREAAALRGCVDVLIAGRYEQDRGLGRGLRGSSNKTVHLFSQRYTLAELDAVPDAEVMVRADGKVVVTGIDPPVLYPTPGGPCVPR